MRETAKSLRSYFILAGLCSVYNNTSGLLASPGILVMVFEAVGLLLALGFLYAGAVLPKLLATSVERINLLLGITAGFAVAGAGVVLLVKGPMIQVYVSGVSVFVCGYLFANVKRLAAEARALPAVS